MIFLFTGKKGELFGYKDHRDGDNFYYTGEGQKGNMEFVRGNKAVRDSAKNGKELHLFEDTKEQTYVKYVGQMECVGYQKIQGKDVRHNPRELIIFKLKLTS